MAELGEAIRAHRRAKGWTQAELGEAVALSNTAIAHFESGAHVPRRDVARRIDDALGAGGRIAAMRDKADDNPDVKWVQKIFKAEQRALRIRHATSLIPALLQNDAYTREILAMSLPDRGGVLEEKIRHRDRRRAIMRRPNPPRFGAVLTEAALHTVVGGAEIMRRQLLDLIEASRLPNVEVRVWPFDSARAWADVGEMTIMDLPNGRTVIHRVPDLCLTRGPSVATHITLYGHLCAAALDAEASRVFIHKLIEEKYPCAPSALTCP
ncbi:helix-turn-helix transcriptional regulator [Streptomyces sp. AV19]|uniref:helix-turn-helix domain-containing protein n=1 Tax=Streptomyces sp. AV19 TaxID=2793068 RepID=UPI0018FEF446|nr:helix-turn-helix transcriptional regulator [Streptomyces sp. AV19]MBH1933919.1 helix-turn-helix transcriptional regulator [Streptomyces sp. AV19]MDG4535597.1 helix-turn-helix transcriptional regulator [Streptomyces sp. AV19]